jgi:WD40 repeat protein
LNKKSGKGEAGSEGAEKPESDFFECMDAGQGEQFMAVRPYMGAIMEPDNHNPNNAAAPDCSYELEYVYGYRCADSRQNVYFNNGGECVYMTAALGVILDHGSNTQKFFGGGQVENTSKQTANDNNSHTNDITSIAISTDRTKAVSGQVGSAPSAFVWNSSTGAKEQRFKLQKGARGVNAVGFSEDGKYIACVDLHNDHNIQFYEVSNGSLVWKEKGDTNKIFDVCFSAQKGSYMCASAGSKHIKFWDPTSKYAKKGIFGGKGDATSMACVTWDNNNFCYTGGCNSKIYVW